MYLGKISYRANYELADNVTRVTASSSGLKKTSAEVFAEADTNVAVSVATRTVSKTLLRNYRRTVPVTHWVI